MSERGFLHGEFCRVSESKCDGNITDQATAGCRAVPVFDSIDSCALGDTTLQATQAELVTLALTLSKLVDPSLPSCDESQQIGVSARSRVSETG